MTDTTTDPGALPDTEVTDTTADPDKGRSKSGAEAAKYRTQLRETEAQRDTLAAKVETLQKAQVEALAADLAKPAALWATGTSLADLLDDDGNVDADKVTEAVARARDELGLAAAVRSPRPDPTQGAQGGTPRASGWVAAMSEH